MDYCKNFSPTLDIRLTCAIDGSPKNHENALVGLVVIGRRLEEEKVTAMLSVIASSLSNQNEGN